MITITQNYPKTTWEIIYIVSTPYNYIYKRSHEEVKCEGKVKGQFVLVKQSGERSFA